MSTVAPAEPSPAPGRGRPWLPPAAAAAALACVLAMVAGGAADPLPVGDPGPVVRWALPLVRAVHDLAAAITVGAFLMGGLLVPESTGSQRRARTARTGARAALVWALAGVVGGMLAYASLSGQGLSDPGFLRGWWTSTWQLELLRAPAITSLLALAAGLVALVERGRNSQAWLLGVAVLALVPLALVGHSASSSDHDAAVNSLAVHLVSAAVWVGGLMVLLALWGSLGRARGAVVARYSRVATWCFVAVAASGVLNAAVRLGSFAALGTRYGALVLAKAMALVVLGAAGFLQRRRVVGALEGDSDDATAARGLFARLALAEVVVMGAAVGIATALARTPTPVAEPTGPGSVVQDRTGYPMPPDYTASHLLLGWRTEWLFLTVSLVAVGLYLAWVRRLSARGDAWPVGRTVAWVAGWAVFAYTLNSGVAIYGRVMFSVHMVEHMIISMVVPTLLVLGTPVTLALRALPRRRDSTLGPRELVLAAVHSRGVRAVANPVVAGAVFFLGLVVFYWSPLFGLSLQTHTGHVLMTVHFLLAGYLFVWSLIGIDPGPPKWPAPIRLLVLMVTLAAHAFFGVSIMAGTTLLAGDFFTALQLPWVPDPLADQQAGGGVAWAAGELPTVVLAILVTRDWLRRDTAQARREERQAGRDDDASLRAYNDYLASLERPAGQGPQGS